MIDSSVALAWSLPDEGSPLARRTLMQVIEEGAHVPPLFSIEFGNALVMAVRRGRIDHAFRRRTFEHVAELSLTIDRDGSGQIWTDAVDLADQHGLTLYDGVYLELSLRTGLRLATLDKRLAKAASAIGVLHG
ncbi:MAG: type II toxin-antitoxin system VapC family toxin [Rhizobiaceae bacterium]